MKRNLTAFAPYGIILILDFYLLPFLAKDTGTAMLLLLCVMPFAAFVSAVIFGIRNGFCITLAIVALVLFIPTVFIHYNSSAWIYAPAYAVIVLAGTGLGRLFYRKQ